MKRIIALVLALVTLTCCAFTLSSCKSDEKELVIGITYFAPMNYKDADGKLIGFETEFAEAVCKELGMKAKFQEIEWESKETELTEDEKKEQAALRQEYINEIRLSFGAMLDNTVIQYPDGTRKSLKKD